MAARYLEFGHFTIRLMAIERNCLGGLKPVSTENELQRLALFSDALLRVPQLELMGINE